MIFPKHAKRVAFCFTCGAHLGNYRNRFAQEHLEQYPNHKEYLVKELVDRMVPEPKTHSERSSNRFNVMR